MRQRPMPKPLREWMDAHGQRDFVTCAVAAYYLQCHYPDLLEADYGVRCGMPRLKDSGLQTYFVYNLWQAETASDDYEDKKTAEEALQDCAHWYGHTRDQCAAAIEFEAWLRGETAPPWPSLKKPRPAGLSRSLASPTLDLSNNEQNQKHKEAMRLSHEADRLTENGGSAEAQRLWLEAFQLEKSVGLSVQKYPARSILLKSAVALAVDAGAGDEAKQLGQLILAESDTPDFVRREVLDLLRPQLE
ncbi:MAG: hypothetical protein J0I12_27950 [Candidatus Eremiobacteraeota bacterium]|nr:hypothetical protein [Candidatus Eremiobacteraeota bacterium]